MRTYENKIDSSSIYKVKTSFVRSFCIHTYLLDQNTVPATTNMINGLAESKLETLAEGTVLFTVSTEDPDSQTHTYRYTCDPPAVEDTFEIDASKHTI